MGDIMDKKKKKVSAAENAENLTDDVSLVSEKKSEVIEHSIVTIISVILLIVASFIKGNDNVARWLYTVSFVAAGYEILYSVIVKLSKKEVIIEEIAVVAGSLVLLYSGYGQYACLIIIAYSLIALSKKSFEYIALNKSEKLSVAAGYETDDEIKKSFVVRAENLKTIIDETPNSKIFEKKFRLIFGAVGIIIGLLLTFVPPIFAKSAYVDALKDKWLICGAIVASLWQLSSVCVFLSLNYIAGFISADRYAATFGSFAAIDKFAEAAEIAFDGSGVLTDKSLTINSVDSTNVGNTLSVLYSLENDIDEYIKSAISVYAKNNGITLNSILFENVKHFETLGVTADFNGKRYAAGNKTLLKKVFGVSVEDDSDESVIFVAEEGAVIGKVNYTRIDKINARGEIKELTDGAGMIASLLSSDKVSVVNAMKDKLGLDNVVAGASPKYKAEYVKNSGAVYVGDSEYDANTIRLLDGECVSVGGEKVYKNGLTVSGRDVRQIPVAVKIAKRTTKKKKFITLFTSIVKAVAIVTGVVLFAVKGNYMSIPILGCLATDVISFFIAAMNLTDPA